MNNETLTVTKNSDPIIEKLRAWICANEAGVTDLSESTNIIETRIIDSLQLMNFVLYIEELRGAPIPEDKINMQSFCSLAAIRTNFFDA